MKTIRVIASGDGTVPYVDESGRFHANRAIGRGTDGAPAAELVPDTHYVRRAMRRGHLVEAPALPTVPVVEAGPPLAPSETPESPAPPSETPESPALPTPSEET